MNDLLSFMVLLHFFSSLFSLSSGRDNRLPQTGCHQPPRQLADPDSLLPDMPGTHDASNTVASLSQSNPIPDEKQPKSALLISLPVKRNQKIQIACIRKIALGS